MALATVANTETRNMKTAHAALGLDCDNMVRRLIDSKTTDKISVLLDYNDGGSRDYNIV